MADKAKRETENAQANAIEGIGSLANEMNSILNESDNNAGGSTGGNTGEDDQTDDDTTKVANNLNKVITGENADLTDSNRNKITVPVGFKIATGSGSTVQQVAYTTENPTNYTKAVIINTYYQELSTARDGIASDEGLSSLGCAFSRKMIQFG